MSGAARKKSTKAKRAPLSGERIALAALALTDQKGLDGLSFRILARKLGCEAMSIYHYFPSKSHLLDAMVVICINEFKLPPEDMHWLERLRAVSMELRTMATRHPGFFLFFVTYRMNSREGLTLINVFIKILEETGLDAETRARHFRCLGYYIQGAGIDEALGYAKGPSAAEPVPDDVAARDFPAVAAIGPYFKSAYHQSTFEHGLEIYLRNIAEDAAAARR